jgi:hypothetical protein
MKKIFGLIAVAAILAGCGGNAVVKKDEAAKPAAEVVKPAVDTSKPLMLCDFESLDEISKPFDILNLKTEFVPENATSGKNCLKLTCIPGDTRFGWCKLTAWTNITPEEKANIIKWWGGEYTEKTTFGNMMYNWEPWDVLKFDIYNPSKELFKIGITVMDENSWNKDGPRYESRYNGEKLIKPGKNTVEIEMNDLFTEMGSKLNVKNIKCIWFTFVGEGKVFYMDNLRMEKIPEGKDD